MNQAEYAETGPLEFAEQAKLCDTREEAIELLQGFTMKQLAEIGAHLGATILHPKRQTRVSNLVDLAGGQRPVTTGMRYHRR